jgi:D-tagatose-1,6-bisphosphate aldolase subunit GatZ/KbaZ
MQVVSHRRAVGAVSLEDVTQLIIRKRWPVTMLGIGPMSEDTFIATLELARDKDFPVMLIASRNQIDAAELGGGYVFCSTQKNFNAVIRRLSRKVGFRGLLYLCRDHGGPWQRDNERAAKLPEAKAMDLAKKSYLADILNGFNVLHIDPTKDPHIPSPIPMEVVIRRTVELIAFVEKERVRRGIGPVSYEIGTDEISGGLTAASAFEEFIVTLTRELAAKRLPKPTFIVGQTGTLVKMRRNMGTTDFKTARVLTEIAAKHGIGFKEHNADYLSTECLRRHPKERITASNVAPEYGVAETEALVKLARMEEKALAKASGATRKLRPSGFIAVIQKAVLDSGRWTKWLIKPDPRLTRERVEADPKMLEEIMFVNGHYTFNTPEVKSARRTLYANLVKLGVVKDPERFVIDYIKKSIDRYVTAFRLKGLTSRVLRELGK